MTDTQGRNINLLLSLELRSMMVASATTAKLRCKECHELQSLTSPHWLSRQASPQGLNLYAP